MLLGDPTSTSPQTWAPDRGEGWAAWGGQQALSTAVGEGAQAGFNQELGIGPGQGVAVVEGRSMHGHHHDT